MIPSPRAEIKFVVRGHRFTHVHVYAECERQLRVNCQNHIGGIHYSQKELHVHVTALLTSRREHPPNYCNALKQGDSVVLYLNRLTLDAQNPFLYKFQ